MSLFLFLGIIMIAGGLGGLVNSLILSKGLVLPHTVPKGDGTNLILPGFIGNVLVGAVAAGVSWSLYTAPESSAVELNAPSSLIALGGAVLVGMAGSGWLANALEKNVFRAVASQIAVSPATPAIAEQLRHATSADVAKIVRELDRSEVGVVVPQAASSRASASEEQSATE